MKSEIFKKLIKQCVKEAMREELPLVLMEYQQRSTTKSTPVITEDMKPLFYNDGNPEEIREVRNSMKNKMSELFGLPDQQAITNQVEVPVENGNPYLAFLVDSAKNMTPQEMAGLKRYD